MSSETVLSLREHGKRVNTGTEGWHTRSQDHTVASNKLESTEKQMDHKTQAAHAEALRALHHTGKPLLLPNAWDAATARIFAQQGFPAIATTSGGVAWALGYGDGENAPLEETLAVVRRMTRVVNLPVTVDFETGYGATPERVSESIEAVIAAGAAGINLEDSLPGHGPLRPTGEAAARIRAARATATQSDIPLVINARVDNWLHAQGADPREPLADAILRGRAYLSAGADCIYPIGLRDPATIAEFVKALNAPVNIMAGPGTPPMAELAKVGVARLSTATWFTALAFGTVRDAAQAILKTGTFDALEGHFNYMDAQALFAKPR